MQSLESLIQSYKNKNISLVVGAQSIFNHDYGKQIDSADLVIRMNRNFPKRKKYQGKKTDLLAISCDISRWQHWRYYRSAPIIWMTPNRESLPSWMARYKAFFLYDENDWERLFNNLGENRPSTGAMTLDFITTHLQPRTLSLFGFDFKKTKTVHVKKQKLGPHNWELEQSYFLEVIEAAKSRGCDWNVYM